MAEPVQRLLDVGGDSVWVEDSGGENAVVLLLHSGVADSTLYDDIWPGLTSVARAIRFDYRAYGRSPAATGPWSVVGDALAVLDGLGVEQAHVVGTSMGGGGALDLAVLHPQRVLSLTLLCPGVNGAQWPDDPATDAEFESVRHDPAGLLDLMLRLWGAAGDDPRVRELAVRGLRAGLNSREFETEPEPSTYARLGEIAVPTTMVVGGRDYPGLVAVDREAARLIPGCRVVELPDVDHYPSVREPDTTLRLILETAELTTA
ncbi:MAG: alpha/beta fold hydrolase [Frankiales bacterium]|nr:alpha/beta fold hydrolase [Frankiales bacterium]